MRSRLILSAGLRLLVGAFSWPACAALESGVYQTFPGTTAVESGDSVPNRSRVVPVSATLTFDLSATPPSLTAELPNAVLEGGESFMLTVRSLSGARLTNGTYRFSGDYLRSLYPSGTQYWFDWRFSASTNGEVVWDGVTGWGGGHLWCVTISNITIVPRPALSIARAGSQVTVSWPSAHKGFLLEQSTALTATDWSTVTNTVDIISNQFSVATEAGAMRRFFRLRRF